MAFGGITNHMATVNREITEPGAEAERENSPFVVREQMNIPIRVTTAPSTSIDRTDILEENFNLRQRIQQLKIVSENSKIETAQLCSTFGKLAQQWTDTVTRMSELHEEQTKNYEKRIEALEKRNEQLVQENEEMRKVIKNFEKLESEFEKQKRELKLGQIAYKLESLVSEYVFPGEDKASKRARYGTNLKSLKGKIGNLKDKDVQKEAQLRLQKLDEEMFEDWFLGVVKKLKSARVDTAHPSIGTYEEMKEVIAGEFSDEDTREDILKALNHLREMYSKLQRPFGK